MAARELDRDARRHGRALARGRASPPRARRGRSRRRRRGRASAGVRLGSQPRGSRSLMRRPLTAKRSKRAATAAGTRARHAHALGACPRARARRRARAARRGGRPPRRARAARRGAACARSSRSIALAPAASSPSPVAPETSTAVGVAEAAARCARVGVEQVGLVEHEQPRRARRRRSPRARRSTAPHHLHQLLLGRRGVDARARAGRRSRVSSSVAPNASTSWWGSLRMKPTVSVSRYGAAAERAACAWSGRACGTGGRARPTSAPVSALSSVDLPALV